MKHPIKQILNNDSQFFNWMKIRLRHIMFIFNVNQALLWFECNLYKCWNPLLKKIRSLKLKFIVWIDKIGTNFIIKNRQHKSEIIRYTFESTKSELICHKPASSFLYFSEHWIYRLKFQHFLETRRYKSMLTFSDCEVKLCCCALR